MRLLLAIIAILLPCYALAGEDIRIVRCTQEQFAVQERIPDWRLGRFDDPERFIWRNLPYAPGCYPLEYARMIKQDEIDDRKRPPAPQIIEPVQVVE